MPRTIALVSCVKSKAATPRPAKELYTSDLFGKTSAFAQKIADAWYILSAKYGLVGPSEIIAPYEKTLKQMPATERQAWAGQVLADLYAEAVRPGDTIVILAGEAYREYLVGPLLALGCRVEIPLLGLSFGKQLRWLKEQL